MSSPVIIMRAIVAIGLTDAVWSLVDKITALLSENQTVPNGGAPTTTSIVNTQIAEDFVEILDKVNEGLADWGASVDTLNAAISNATAATSTFNDLFLAFEKTNDDKLREIGEGFTDFTSAVSKLDLEQLDAVRETVEDLLDAALKWRKFEWSQPNRKTSDSTENSDQRASNAYGAANSDMLAGGIGRDYLSSGDPNITLTSSEGSGGSPWPWSASGPEIAEARGALEDLQARLDELDFDWQGTFERMKGVMLDFARTGKFEWRDLAKIALDAIQDMLEAWLKLQQQKAGKNGGETDPRSIILSTAGQVAGSLFGGGQMGGAGLEGGIEPTFSPDKRAAGGPVSAFTPYLIGERGPELFVPRVPGEIVPNHVLGAATSQDRPAVNQTIIFNVSPGVPEAVRREVAAMIPHITQAAKAGVASDFDRNSGLRRRLN